MRKVKAFATLTALFFLFMVWVVFFKLPEPRYPLFILGALPLLLSPLGALNAARTELTVSGGIVRYRSGIVSETTRAMELRKLQDIRVERSAGQMMWGLGTLILETAGESGAFVMEDIERPQQIADWILEASRSEGK